MHSGLQADVVWCRGSGLSCHTIGAHNESSPIAHHALGLTRTPILLPAKGSTLVARKPTGLRVVSASTLVADKFRSWAAHTSWGWRARSYLSAVVPHGRTD